MSDLVLPVILAALALGLWGVTSPEPRPMSGDDWRDLDIDE